MYQNKDVRFQDFMTKYVNAISEKFPELERTRRNLLLQSIFVIIIAVLIMIILYKLLGAAAISYFILISILPLICIYHIIRKYSKYIKNNVLHNVLEECFNIKLISEIPDVLRCGLWPNEYSILKIDDCFKMVYKNLECKIYELIIGATSNNSNFDRNFRGVVIQFSNNKKLNGKVMIRSKKRIGLFVILFIGELLLGIIITLLLLSMGMNIDEIVNTIIPIVLFPAAIILIIMVFSLNDKKNIQKTIGSEEFRKYFDVYADNTSEAEIEVTSKLITKFFNFKSRFKDKSIACSFYEDKILFAINGRDDLFEIGNLFVPINKSKTVYKFYNDVNMLYEVMDYFFR